MTAADDMERVRRGYAAWNSGDVERALEVMSEDVEVYPVLGDVVSADSFRGHDGIRRWFETIHASFEGFRADIEDLVEASDGRYVVLLRFSGRGKASGAEVSLQAAHVVTVREGLLARLDGYESWEQALRAADVAERA